MPDTMKLARFCSYVGEQGRAIRSVYTEIEQVQYQFNEIYRQKMQEWQAAMAKTVPMLAEGQDLPPALAQDLLKAIAEEQAKLEKEIADLTSQVRAKRAEADRAIDEAQAEVAALRQMNPQLNSEEEELKAHCAASQQTIRELEAQIKHAGILTGFLRRRRLVRQRNEQRTTLAADMAALRQVRQRWDDEKKRTQTDQSRLQSVWEAASIEAAQLQARLDYLAGNLERLGRQNGAGKLLAEMVNVPDAPEPLRAALTEMVELNRVKAEYEEGLRAVAEALGLLKGLAEGMERFQKSADKVLEEQRQYNLRELQLRLSDEVLRFHALWPEFGNQVRDEKMLGTHPAEFSQRVHAIIKDRLGEQAIAATFDSMGEALTQATKAWG